MTWQTPRFRPEHNPSIGRNRTAGTVTSTKPHVVDKKTAVRALPPNPERKKFFVQNQSAGAIYLEYDRPASPDNLMIPAGGSIHEDMAVATGAIYIVGTLPTDQRIVVGETF